MGLTLTYEPTLARVQLVADTWGATVTYIVVDRFDTTTLTNPEVVRGGATIPVTVGAIVRLDDYEFTPGVANTYRVRAYNASDVEVPTYSYTAAITPILGGIWIKSVLYPFANQPVTVIGFSEVTTPARGGLLEVLGRRDPVAVAEVRGSRRYTLTVRAADASEARALALLLSFGGTVLIHVPPDCVVPESMHAFPGDIISRQAGRHDSAVRYLEIPLTECAAPAASVVGSTATYAGLAAAFPTYADLAAALPTYLDVAQYVAAPADEVVG